VERRHFVGVGHDAVVEGLHHRPDASKRGAEIVRDPGDQLTARAVELGSVRAAFVEPPRAQVQLAREPGELVGLGPIEDESRRARPERARGPGERVAFFADALAQRQSDENARRAGGDQD